MSPPHRFCLIVLCSAHLMFGVFAGENEKSQSDTLKPIYSKIQMLVKQHYPEATSKLAKNEIQFEYNTKIFEIPADRRAQKVGATEQAKGPAKGGILGTIEFRKGKYGGAAKVPQTFDKRYFKMILMAPYSAKYDCHLYVHLYVPKSGSKLNFTKELTRIIDSFETHLGRK